MGKRRGRPAIGTNGFGITSVSSFSRLPRPPQKMTTGMSLGADCFALDFIRLIYDAGLLAFSSSTSGRSTPRKITKVYTKKFWTAKMRDAKICATTGGSFPNSTPTKTSAVFERRLSIMSERYMRACFAITLLRRLSRKVQNFCRVKLTKKPAKKPNTDQSTYHISHTLTHTWRTVALTAVARLPAMRKRTTRSIDSRFMSFSCVCRSHPRVEQYPFRQNSRMQPQPRLPPSSTKGGESVFFALETLLPF